MVMSRPKRPDVAIDKIIRALRPFGEIINIKARQRIGWRTQENGYLYLLLRGEISVLRVTDSLLLGSTTQPHVFGFTELFSPMRYNFLRAETDCALIRVDATLALHEIGQQGLWRAVAELSVYHTNTMVHRDIRIVNRRTPPVVHSYLRELDNLPEAKKHQVNILHYIQERTGLSRSSILNVLTSLKKNNFIDYERGGYQLKVNRLPD